jgi:alkylation response protein AidB-like acyl-CoA dehydrogenase
MSEASDVRSADLNNSDPLARARQLIPLVRAFADESERERRLARPVVDAVRAAGLFAMGLPRSLGGLETSVGTAMRAIEEASYADGATGWNVMIAFDAGLWAGHLGAPQTRAMIASIERPIIAASVNPPGRIHRSGEGYRLTGRWRFGSGCQQADVFLLPALLHEGDKPVIDPAGMPAMVVAAAKSADVSIVDTWRVVGLRGTGSHDFTVNDLAVAGGLVEPINFTEPVERGTLYAFPMFMSFAAAKAAVAIGIARRAVEYLMELAQAKTPMGQTSLLRDRPAIQADVARAEAIVRSARAFLHETIAEVWDALESGKKVTEEQRAHVRIAAVDGVTRAAHAVDLMYNAAGASAIYETSPLERCFRDAHVVTAHIVVQPAMYEVSGRVLLGLPAASPVW